MRKVANFDKEKLEHSEKETTLYITRCSARFEYHHFLGYFANPKNKKESIWLIFLSSWKYIQGPEFNVDPRTIDPPSHISN